MSVELRELPVPDIGESDVLLRVGASRHEGNLPGVPGVLRG